VFDSSRSIQARRFQGIGLLALAAPADHFKRLRMSLSFYDRSHGQSVENSLIQSPDPDDQVDPSRSV
jgi:hypothetical protein